MTNTNFENDLSARLTTLGELGRPERRPDLGDLEALTLAAEPSRTSSSSRHWWSAAALVAVMALAVGVVANARSGPANTDVVAPPETTEPVEEATTATTHPSEPEPVAGEIHRVDIEGRDLTVSVQVPLSYVRPPNHPSAIPESALHIERWLDPETGGSIGWSAQVDPGDDAPLFQYEVADELETVLGTWTVHELGEGMFTHYMAMVRHDGVVYQVIGGAPGNPSPVIEMARSMELGELTSS